jgi:hypothetical protein
MSDPTSDLMWLCEWFASQCDGDWEHEFGISIGTLDNPGWSLRIDLTRTALRDSAFPRVELEGSGGWMRMWKDDSEAVLNGTCSPQLLPDLLSRFRGWATGSQPLPGGG